MFIKLLFIVLLYRSIDIIYLAIFFIFFTNSSVNINSVKPVLRMIDFEWEVELDPILFHNGFCCWTIAIHPPLLNTSSLKPALNLQSRCAKTSYPFSLAEFFIKTKLWLYKKTLRISKFERQLLQSEWTLSKRKVEIEVNFIEVSFV